MLRRHFAKLLLPAALAGSLFAKNPDRLSGVVRSVDKAKMLIEINLSSNPNSVRKIIYEAATQFTLDDKPAQADAIKDGLRIVAIGKFESLDLKATKVSLKHR